MRTLAAALAALVLCALAVAGCGGKADHLSSADAQKLTVARAQLDDALDTEETLRTSLEEAARLRARARAIIRRGKLEDGKPPDEFGLSALGRLNQLVPSLVLGHADGSVRALDTKETAAFMRYATTDSAKALYPAAQHEVTSIEGVTGADDVGADTTVGGRLGRQKVGAYLKEAERDVRRPWPGLADRLARARDGL
jgi:outer membrane murein-binding lipoprotein Lpp